MNLRNVPIAIAVALFSWPLAAEDDLTHIDRLIASGQCLDALSKIQEADPESKHPEYFLRKLDISLNCSVRHIHGMDAYAFTNLTNGESLAELQNSPPRRDYPLHTWPIFQKIQEHHPSLIGNPRFVVLALSYFEWNCATEGDYSGIDGPLACSLAHRVATEGFRQQGYSLAICKPYVRFSIGNSSADETDKVIEACLRDNQNDPGIRLLKAVHLSGTNRINEAIQLGKTVAELAEDPELSSRSSALVGVLSYESANYSDAENYFRKSIDASSIGLASLQYYFSSLLHQDRLDKAESELLRILQLHAGIRPAYIEGVRIAFQESNRQAEFVSIAKRVADLATKDPLNQVVLYRTLAVAQIELKRLTDAQQSIQRGLELNSTLRNEYQEQIAAEFQRLADEVKTLQSNPE